MVKITKYWLAGKLETKIQFSKPTHFLTVVARTNVVHHVNVSKNSQKNSTKNLTSNGRDKNKCRRLSVHCASCNIYGHIRMGTDL